MLVGVLSNFGCLLIADVGIQSCDEHKGLIHQLVDSCIVGLNSIDAVFGE